MLIENFRPGGLARFGLDYDTVAATNPGVVYASISGFGSGPKGAALPGYDLIVQAISGLMSLTGDPDGEPYRAGISVFDVMAGLHATIGILAALNLRHETGRGQHVEVNLLSSALSGLVNQSSAYVAGGDRADPDGQQPPEPVPLRAAALLRRRPDHHRRQRRPVPQAGRGARRARARRRPAVRPQRGPHRQPRGAAAAAGRAAAAPAPRTSGSATSSPRACRAGRSTPSTAASPSPSELGLDPVVEVGEGDAAMPSVRNPITFSETPADYVLPPPGLDEHGEEIRVAG